MGFALWIVMILPKIRSPKRVKESGVVIVETVIGTWQTFGSATDSRQTRESART